MSQSAIVASKARAFIDEHQISRLKRCAEELKNEKVSSLIEELLSIY